MKLVSNGEESIWLTPIVLRLSHLIEGRCCLVRDVVIARGEADIWLEDFLSSKLRSLSYSPYIDIIRFISHKLGWRTTYNIIHSFVRSRCQYELGFCSVEHVCRCFDQKRELLLRSWCLKRLFKKRQTFKKVSGNSYEIYLLNLSIFGSSIFIRAALADVYIIYVLWLNINSFIIVIVIVYIMQIFHDSDIY